MAGKDAMLCTVESTMCKSLPSQVVLIGALVLSGCLGPFSDKEWYCKGAAEGVPPESARQVYQYCLRNGYDDHKRDERRCSAATFACCPAWCRCKMQKPVDPCRDQLQHCGAGHGCSMVISEDCRC